MNDFEKDRKELYDELSRLELQKLKGSSLSCGCGNKGHFGAMTIFTSNSGRKYQICGWCGMISKQKDGKKSQRRTMRC